MAPLGIHTLGEHTSTKGNPAAPQPRLHSSWRRRQPHAGSTAGTPSRAHHVGHVQLPLAIFRLVRILELDHAEPRQALLSAQERGVLLRPLLELPGVLRWLRGPRLIRLAARGGHALVVARCSSSYDGVRDVPRPCRRTGWLSLNVQSRIHFAPTHSRPRRLFRHTLRHHPCHPPLQVSFIPLLLLPPGRPGRVAPLHLRQPLLHALARVRDRVTPSRQLARRLVLRVHRGLPLPAVSVHRHCASLLAAGRQVLRLVRVNRPQPAPTLVLAPRPGAERGAAVVVVAIEEGGRGLARPQAQAVVVAVEHVLDQGRLRRRPPGRDWSGVGVHRGGLGSWRGSLRLYGQGAGAGLGGGVPGFLGLGPEPVRVGEVEDRGAPRLGCLLAGGVGASLVVRVVLFAVELEQADLLGGAGPGQGLRAGGAPEHRPVLIAV
mmetsp:Transcript_75116/g.200488  ORF Transcript_75116/g.200488 Transcript_75116/m.200488 type:complete len:433 (-) Transcript_75116:698-1996(-)